jgi:hypothetical protein
MTYREFADTAKRIVRDVGHAFTTADADWAPAALLALPDGSILVAMLDMNFFASEALKDTLADDVLPALVAQHKANKLALVLSAWMRVLAADAPDDGIRPSQAPDRQEVLVVGVYDAERVEVHLARILRDGKRPPRLARWNIESADASGRFFGQRVQEVMR